MTLPIIAIFTSFLCSSFQASLPEKSFFGFGKKEVQAENEKSKIPLSISTAHLENSHTKLSFKSSLLEDVIKGLEKNSIIRERFSREQFGLFKLFRDDDLDALKRINSQNLGALGLFSNTDLDLIVKIKYEDFTKERVLIGKSLSKPLYGALSSLKTSDNIKLFLSTKESLLFSVVSLDSRFFTAFKSLSFAQLQFLSLIGQ